VTDLVETLTRMGIEPLGKTETRRTQRRFTEHRTIEPPVAVAETAGLPEFTGIVFGSDHVAAADAAPAPGTGIAIGDKIVLLFSDNQKRISVRLTEGSNDLDKGRLSIASPLGQAILGAEEGDEIELAIENGRQRKALIESVEKLLASAGMPLAAEVRAEAASEIA
jgi:hypothetical protein